MFGHDEHDYVSPYEWQSKQQARAHRRGPGSSSAVPDYARADGVPLADLAAQRARSAAQSGRSQNQLGDDQYASDYAWQSKQQGRAHRRGPGTSSAVPDYARADGAPQAAHAAERARSRERLNQLGQDPAFRHAAGMGGPPPMDGWPGGIFGALGADVPYTTRTGQTGTAHTSSQMSCGSPFGVQQMLVDLGYPVAIDGQIGPETFGALDSFAADHGVSYAHGSLPQGEMCMALDRAWLDKMQPGSPTEPPSPQAPANDPNATGFWDRLQNWWHTAPTSTKVMVVGGGGVVIVIGAMAVMGPAHATKHAHATPNRKRKRLPR